MSTLFQFRNRREPFLSGGLEIASRPQPLCRGRLEPCGISASRPISGRWHQPGPRCEIAVGAEGARLEVGPIDHSSLEGVSAKKDLTSPEDGRYDAVPSGILSRCGIPSPSNTHAEVPHELDETHLR